MNTNITIGIDQDAEGWETARSVLGGWTVRVRVAGRPVGHDTVTGWVNAQRSAEVERSPLWVATPDDAALGLVEENGGERVVRTSEIVSVTVL